MKERRTDKAAPCEVEKIIKTGRERKRQERKNDEITQTHTHIRMHICTLAPTHTNSPINFWDKIQLLYNLVVRKITSTEKKTTEKVWW